MSCRFLWFIILIVCHGANDLAAAEQPNFLFVLADDCTYLDLECYGGQAKTPTLNRLCEQGKKFMNCYQAAPMCSPTRHCLYTGLYPVRSGAYPNHTFVKAGTESVAHFLKDRGYRVALSGKKHINPPESFPFEYSAKNNNPDFAAIDTLFRECREEGQPFCLFVCSNEPHTPWNLGDPSQYPPGQLKLPPCFVDTPETRVAYSKYLAEVTFFDRQVGQCLELLDRHDLSGDTMVLVASEQGNSFPFAKWTCYDVGLASALIVRWPGRVESASVTEALVEYVDVVPTILEAAGEHRRDLDGKSFLDVLCDREKTHKEYVFGLQTSRGIINGPERFGIRSVRSQHYRLVLNVDSDQTFRNAVTRRKGWWDSWVQRAHSGDSHAENMVVRYQKRPRVEMFDVQKDPWNMIDVADNPDLAGVREKLMHELQAWMRSQGDDGSLTEQRALKHQWRNRPRRGTKPTR